MRPAALSDISAVVLNNFCRAEGGASRVAIDAAIGLANAGVRVFFLGAVGPVCAELEAAPLEVICLQQRQLIDAPGSVEIALQGLWNVPAYRAVGALLGRLEPARTVVHVHGFTQALSASPVRCALNRGFKVVYTLHDFFSACPNGAFFDYVSGGICHRRALSLGCMATNCDKRRFAHKMYRVARAAIQRQIGGMPGGVKDFIALSRRSAELLRPYLPPDAQIHYVPNPVDVAKLPPVEVAGNRELVVVGRLDPEKGIDVLLEAAVRSGTSLTFVGDGSLRAKAEATGLCRVTGWVSRDQVMAALQAARCLVFPSLWYETYGLAVDEAAARGVPSIVSDISAAAERVEHRVTGWHVRAGDVASLARCLSDVRDDAVVESAGRAAYAHWWSRPPTRDVHVAGLTAVYRSMLERAV